VVRVIVAGQLGGGLGCSFHHSSDVTFGKFDKRVAWCDVLGVLKMVKNVLDERH
jgi:hypothetical protein